MDTYEYIKKLNLLLTAQNQIPTKICDLRKEYLERNSIPVGTPVVYQGQKGHVIKHFLTPMGRIKHTIRKAKKDGSPSIRGKILTSWAEKEKLELF